MLEEHESYVPAIGFAYEPVGQKRKWLGRVILALVVAGVGWIFLNRVIPTPDDSPRPPAQELPGPV